MNRRNTTIRKKQILEASRVIIVKYGSENVTIRRIAKEVGITEGAIYRHFKSKKEVLFSLADFSVSSLLDDLSTPDEISGNSTRLVESIFNKHIAEIEKRRGSSFQIIAEIISFGDKKLNKRVYEGLSRYVEKLSELLELYTGNDKKRHKLDSDAASLMLFGMIQGLVNIWALSNYNFDFRDRFTRMWQIYRKEIMKA